MDTIKEITFGKDRYHLHREMEAWCQDNVGEGGWNSDRLVWDEGRKWATSSMFGNTTFAFKNERDYIWFVLRWSA